MKIKNGVLLIASFVLLICVLGFGGCGNSGMGYTTGPGSITISNLSPTTLTFTHNSGTKTVTVTFDATGNVDMPVAHFVFLNDSGQSIISYYTNVTSPNTSGVVSFSFGIDTSLFQAGSKGTYNVYMTDSLGAVSNTLVGSWNAT